MNALLDLAAHALWLLIALGALAFVIVLVTEHVQTIRHTLTTTPKEHHQP